MSSASLQISCILWNTKLYKTVYIIRLSLIILSQMNKFHVRHFLYIHLIIIFSSVFGSSKCPFPYMSPHQYPVCTSPVIHMCYMPHPSHNSYFYHPNDTVLTVPIISSPSYSHASPSSPRPSYQISYSAT